MKNRSRFILTTLLFSFFLLTANASHNSEFSIQVFNSNTFLLNVEKEKSTQIQILLKDTRGITLYKETFNRASVQDRKYQLEKLPFGMYTFIVEFDGIIKIQPIKKGYEILEIDPLELQTIFKPTLLHTSGHLDLKVPHTSDFKVSLEIEDNANHTLYDEHLSLVQPLQKRYDILQLEDGTYFFNILIKNGSFEYEFQETFVVSSLVAAN